MLGEEEFADLLSDRLSIIEDGNKELDGAEVSRLPSDNAGFAVTLVDGTKFAVVVTKINEGDC
jgi:hypothetical protein